MRHWVHLIQHNPGRSALIALGIALIGVVESLLLGTVLVGLLIQQVAVHWVRYGDATDRPFHPFLATPLFQLAVNVVIFQVQMFEWIGTMAALVLFGYWLWRRARPKKTA